jgi:CheY-like chemotaxis protein
MNSALIIDDNPINQKVLQLYLKSYVSYMDWALTAQSGIQKIKAKTYDYVLVDIHLPDMNGIDLTKYILENNLVSKQTSKLIAITGDRSVEDNAEAQEIFDGILIKPFTRTKLIKLLGNPKSTDDKRINLNSVMPLLETHADKAQFFSLLQKSLRHYYDQLKNPTITGNIDNLRGLVHKVEPVFKMIEQTQLIEEVRKYYSLPDSTRIKTLLSYSETLVPLIKESQDLSSNLLKEVS